MNTVMAESQARTRTVQEYEAKMLDMERHYQERMREEVTLLPSFLPAREPPH
jgi:hypothetical protein